MCSVCNCYKEQNKQQMNLHIVDFSHASSVLIVDFPHASSRNEKRESNERRLSFEGIEINFIEDLSQTKHKDDLWFTNGELKSFKHQFLRFRRAANANSSINSVQSDLLSAPTPRAVRQEIRRVVLIEQQRQSRAGICNPETIAKVSAAASDLSRKQARIIALLNNAVRDTTDDETDDEKTSNSANLIHQLVSL